jgi:citronellol/citronellal dehydrogenase
MNLSGRRLLVTGGSRGIGLAIAVKAARDGANVVVAAKTLIRTQSFRAPSTLCCGGDRGGWRQSATTQARHPGRRCGGETVKTAGQPFPGIDICGNNASAINLSPSLEMEVKRFDLIQQINMRGTFRVSRACIPYLKASSNPHILALSPPLDMHADWFAQHLPYTMSKYGMSTVMFGMAEEFEGDGIACNSLWPRTTIATAPVEFALGGEAVMRRSRRPEIMADAAYAIFHRNSQDFTGRFMLD